MQSDSQVDHLGYDILPDVFSDSTVTAIAERLDQYALQEAYGLREFLLSYPDIAELVLSHELHALLQKHFAEPPLLIKSIYFDKPPAANWIVNWHQDLTINVDQKRDLPGFSHWRDMGERVVVRPPLSLLEQILTVRIHLDYCTSSNGALKVIPGSHQWGVVPLKEWTDNKSGEEVSCEVPRGGVVLMRPLTLHASMRTENEAPRRVIHLEFTAASLPDDLHWKEALPVPWSD